MNELYCGDNLEIMSKIPSESVDLCYIDPPFFTSRQYEVIWGDGAEKRAFEDRWVKMGENGRYSKDINVYLDFMEPRLKEIHRILKPTGSFYLHCDWHADAYLRVACDTIFGSNKLVNQIIWKRHNGNFSSKDRFGIISDTIFWYEKEKHQFNPQYSEEKGIFPLIEEETGRKFRSHGMTKSGPSPNELLFPTGNIKLKKGMRFVWSQKTLNERLKSNPYCIYYSPKTEIPQYKMYEDEYKGTILSNLWEDLPVARSESLGYPTQKPEVLLERIINASSNEGDVVMDSFCGCGTTLAVCKRLKRQYIGIDISPTACRLIATRISHPISEIIGLPLSSDEIAALSGFEFQNAVIRALDPSLTTIKIGGKGADGGIDGSYYDVLISVKKYKAGRVDLDEFIATLYRNKKKKGIFIALGYSADFKKEVSRLKRDQEITIHSFTLAEIIDEKKHEAIISEENKKHGKLV